MIYIKHKKIYITNVIYIICILYGTRWPTLVENSEKITLTTVDLLTLYTILLYVIYQSPKLTSRILILMYTI
jgi:hypothetical protein